MPTSPRILRTALAAAVAVTTSAPAAAQSLPDLGLEWRWVDFGPESGLPSGPVLGILEVDTLVWVRTAEGVAWYDGFQWITPTPAGDAAPEGATSSLAPDSSGGVWLVQGDRLYRADRDSVRPHPVPLPDSIRVGVAVPWGRGGVLFTTLSPDFGLYVYAGDQLRRVEEISGTVVPRSLTLTKSGRAWICSEDGFYVFREGRWVLRLREDGPLSWDAKVVESPGGVGLIHRAQYDPAGDLVALDGHGGERPVPTEGANLAWGMDVDDSGLAIVAYETGDIRMRTGEGWRDLPIPTGRRSGIRTVHIGRNGDLWFGGSSGLHLYRTSLNRFGVIRQPFPDPRNRVNAILRRDNGELWLGTGRGVLSYGGLERGTWTFEADGVELRGVTGLAEDEAGRIWASSGGDYEGVVVFDGARASHLDADDGMDVGYVHRLFTARDGAVWLASLGGSTATPGFYRWKDGTLETPSDLGLPEAKAYAWSEAPDGTLWLGYSEAFYRVRAGEVTSSRDFSGDPGPRPRYWDVTLDRDGNPWFAFSPDLGRGLLRVEGDSVRIVAPAAAGPARRTWSVLADARGWLWAGTEGGVLLYRDGVWTRFGEESGLATLTVWPLVATDSSLLVGTKGGGLVAVSLDEADDPPPRVVIWDVGVREGVGRVRFSALAHWGSLPSHRISTRHRVDGGAWTEWSTSREAVLGELDPGTHRVEVQARGFFGRVSPPAAAVVQVPPPLLLRPEVGLPLGGALVVLLALAVAAYARKVRQDRALRLSEARLRTLLDHAPDAILILDAQRRRFVEANTRALDLLGVSADDLEGVEPESLIAEEGEGPAPFVAALNRALQGETPVFQWHVRDADGTAVPVEARLAALPHATRSLVRVSFLDIRDRKREEERRAEVEAQLRQAQKMDALGKLSGGIAHDFNNLLTVIQGSLELLLESGDATPEERQLLTEALDAVAKSTDLSRRLLAVGRKQPLAARPVDVAGLLGRMEELLRRSLGERIQLRISCPPGTWLALSDESQIENAVLNLAINARDAMPSGGIMDLAAWNLTVSEHGDPAFPELAPGDYVGISVTDTGRGMEPEVVARAFDPFFTTKEVGKGTGLGLSMVHGFATQSGGSARIVSRVGSGTRVEFVLPRAPDPAAGEEAPGAPATLPRGSGQVILVVEDDPGVVKLLDVLLAHLGYRSRSAVDAPDALQVLTGESDVDAVLTDIVLPGPMSGVDLAEELETRGVDLPVAFMSGYGEEALENLSQRGAFVRQPLLRKPFDQSTLAMLLHDLFRRDDAGPS